MKAACIGLCAVLAMAGAVPGQVAAATAAKIAMPRIAPGGGQASGSVVFASIQGAALDSDLLQGGGTDDTAVLQGVLDRAQNGKPLHLVIERPALVGGLNVYGNTTIECLKGAGLYLKDNSRRAVIRNAHRSRDGITDGGIAVRGCFLNGNHDHQPGTMVKGRINNQLADGSFIVGVEFLGVNDLEIRDTVLWNSRAFGALIGNASRIDIHNVTVDHGMPPDVDMHYANTDGLHFKGPLRYLTIEGVRLRTGDDGLAFNADDGTTDDLATSNDFGPYVRSGPITDVTVNNVELMDAVQAMRFLSAKQRIDRIAISNVTGTLRGNWLATISHFMIPGAGNIGSILFNNVNVDCSDQNARISVELTDLVRGAKENKGVYAELNEGVFPLFNINTQIEHLAVRNFRTTVVDNRPIVRIGPDGRVHHLQAEISIRDPKAVAVPLEIDTGGRIDTMNISVDKQ